MNEGFRVDYAWFRGRCAKRMLAREGICSSDGLQKYLELLHNDFQLILSTFHDFLINFDDFV